MPQLDPTERLMLAFAWSWRRFGGGPEEDIMVQFGLTAPEFFRRLQQILQAGRHDMDEQTTAELLAVCRRRVWTRDFEPSDATGKPLRPPA